MFRRSLEYFANRFHEKQTTAWLAYKAGHNLHLPWGRRSGKTDLIAEIFIEDIEDNGKDCLFTALTGDQAFNIFWPKLLNRLDGNRDWKPNYGRHEWVHLPSKAKIGLKGLDLGKHRLRGDAKRIIALDEYAFAKDPSIVKEVFIPMLADYNGQLIYSSSPNGENHFYELGQMAKRGEKNLFSITCTMFDNPFISEAGRKMLIDEYTGPDDPLYRQEVLGEYVVLEGMAFALPQGSYTERRWDPADLDHSFHWQGFDHGFNPDPTACLWIAYNRRKGYFQVYNEYKKSKLLIHQHSDAIKGIDPYPILQRFSDIDPQIIAEYNAVGLSMVQAHKFDKNARILRIVNALKTGKLKIADNCTELLAEMKSYVWDQDGNDHLVDALNYGFTNAVVPEEPKPEVAETYFPRSHGRDFQSKQEDFDGQNFDDD